MSMIDEVIKRLELQSAAISQRLIELLIQQEKNMHNLDEITADMAQQTTLIGGLATFISGLKQQLTDALAGVKLPPDNSAQIDALFAAVEANNAVLAAALTANTTAAPAADPTAPVA